MVKTGGRMNPDPSLRDPVCSRTVNWLEHTRVALESRVPATRGSSSYITQRLTALLFERLPVAQCQVMLGLLPDEIYESSEFKTLLNCAEGGENRSIGYTSFVERAETSLGVLGSGDPSPESDLA